MAEVKTYALPLRLYRYRPITDEKLDQELTALEDRFVYCAGYAKMNDPMEGSHTESALLKETPNVEGLLGEVTEEISALGIASFAEAKDHEPMWAHYANGFSGICVQYNFSRLRKALPSYLDFVRMAYSETPPVLLKDSRSASERARLVLSTKTLRWASEREWRLISHEVGPVHYYHGNCVERVYLGARLNARHRAEIIQRLKDMRISISEMSVDAYELSFDKIWPRKKLTLKRKKRVATT